MTDREDNALVWGERELKAESNTHTARILAAFQARIGLVTKIAVALAVLVIIVPASVHFTPAGHGGVLWKLFYGGTVHQASLQEGIHFKWPWNRLTDFDLRMQDLYVSADAISNDGLPVKINVALRYRVNPERASHLYQDVGTEYSKVLISPATGAIVRETVSRYRADELYAFARSRLEREVKELVSDRLDFGRGDGRPLGAANVKDGYVRVEELAILDITLPENVVKAIERKMEADQHAQAYEFRIKSENMEIYRKNLEVKGIENYARITETRWFQNYMRFVDIQAKNKLAESPNAKLVFMGEHERNVSLQVTQP